MNVASTGNVAGWVGGVRSVEVRERSERDGAGRTNGRTPSNMEASTENVVGWVGGAESPRGYTVPSEPASEALCTSVGVERTDAHSTTPVFWGNLLGYRVLGATTATFGVQFYLTAQGTAVGRGYFTNSHEGARFTNVIYKCIWK